MVWFFARDGLRLRYEIRRAPGADLYELEVTFPDGRTETQQTPDAAELLERCAELGRMLKNTGWQAP